MDNGTIDFLSGDSEMARRIRAFDWATTPLGKPETWPDALKTTLSTILNSRFPQALVWGPALTTFYNDAFIPILDQKPPALGKAFSDIWAEAWDEIGPICDAAFRGEATFIENFPLIVERGRHSEQAYFTFCYSPVRDHMGQVVGMIDIVVETTETVQTLENRQRLDFLDELTRAMQEATDASQLMTITTSMVAAHLKLSNCAYADMDADQDGFTIRGDWPAPGSPSIVGHYRLADFGTLAVASLSAGKPLVIQDNLAELPMQEAAVFQSLGITATICMPLVKEGRLTALMAIHDRVARNWSDYDITIIREVTERSWAHIQRVSTEEDLRRAEEAGGIGLFTVDIPSGSIQGTEQFRRIFGMDPTGPLTTVMTEKLVLPEDAHIASTQERRESGEAVLDVQYRIRRANDGEVRAIARRAEYERDASGKPVRLLGAVRDVTAQWQAQRAVAESEAQFRTLAQVMPSMVWTAAGDGNVDWFNDRVYAYCGEQPGTLDNKSWGRMVHSADRARSLASWRRCLKDGSPYEEELRLRRHDGLYRWHLARAIATRDTDGAISRWVGTNTDIHERVLSNVASERDRERMWIMSRDLLVVCDLQGIIVDVNPTATRLLDWTPKEMIGHAITDFIHPDDIATTEKEFEKITAGAATLSFENRYRSRSGDYLLLDWTAVRDKDRVHGIGRDITASRSIARDQERIWSLSPVLKLVASLDATILKVNPAWIHALGWKAEDVAGRSLVSFVGESDREKAGATLDRLMLGTMLSDIEVAMVAQDGSERQIAWNFVAESGSIFGFGRDITEQRMAEDALRQSQKMEAVGQLTGGIAHDFNNLLQGISGNLELLQRRIDQGRTEGLDRFVKGAATSTSRAAALTHRLLAFSRRQPLDPRPVRANPLVASMEDMLRRTLGERIELELVLAGGLWLTKCDPNQLESAILNLAINGRDAMPEGGKLVIETCNAHLDNAYTARQRDLRPGQYICICVTDTGTGMDADTMAKAFEPFFTTKPLGQGTGLGLSMIYGFTRQSEGYTKIYSEVGKGSTIKIYLPRYRGEVDDDEAVPQLSADHATDSGETVLVVEDEPIVRGLIVEVLGELGYRAIEAENGPSGLHILQSNRRIDLLVTDIGLPGMNGREVADAARLSRPDLKILFMTGYAENAALASGFLEPGMEMITKPFAMEALASRIREMIERG